MFGNVALIALGIGLICGSLASAADPAPGTPAAKAPPVELEPMGVIYKTKTPPVIDGSLDDPCWKQAATIKVNYAHNKKLGQRDADVTPMTVKYCWDEHYLYVGYETFDKNMCAKGTGKMQGPDDNKRPGAELWDDFAPIDVVEFFLNVGDNRFFWELHHNALNQFNDVFIVVPDPSWPISKTSIPRFGIIFMHEEYLKDEPPYKLAMAVKLKPKVNGQPAVVKDVALPENAPTTKPAERDPADADTGYTAELRIPWFGLGAPASRKTTISHPATQPEGKPWSEPGPWKMAGWEFGILAVVQDGDLQTRYHRSGPFTGKAWMHEDAEYWPRYKLVEETGPAAPEMNK